jgi:RNA polymerase sigma factor (sigma-70 family)
MVRPSARELLDSCALGPETSAWGELVQRFGPAIEAGVRHALRRGGVDDPDPGSVEDLVQECYCRLLERGGRRLRGCRGSADAEVRAWLRRVAERSTYDRLRSAAAEKRGPVRLLPVAGAHGDGAWADPVASPERRLLGRERLRQMTRGWRRLARTDREARVVRMVFFGGLTSSEAAAAAGGRLTPSSVDSVVFRFRRRLADAGLPVPLRG